MTDLFKKGLDLLFRRQTSILSAAFVIMSTVVLSQILGLIRQRLLVSIFGPSNDLGVYLAASRLPDFLFQVVIAVAISSAFIPVFAGYLSKNERQEAQRMASGLLTIGLTLFSIFGALLAIFAPFLLQIMNIGTGFSPDQMQLMVNLMRLLLIAQLLFMVGMFFTAVLQTYNHFFIPGIAAALYNFGIIIGILTLQKYGMYAPTIGNIIGALLFVCLQIPLLTKLGLRFEPNFDYKNKGLRQVFCLMWPRSLANIVYNISAVLTVGFISFIPSSGRNYVIFDLAQTLAFAPVTLFGQSIAQAAFPVLAREKDHPEEFKSTLLTSFSQLLFLVLPVSVLLLVLRIPIVRLVYGASTAFDWPATVLTGRTLAFFTIAIFSESMKSLIARAFYALHDTKTLLIVSTASTIFMLCLTAFFVIVLNLGVMSIAFSYSLASIAELFVLFFLLDKRLLGFNKRLLITSWGKIFIATFFTAFALYIPIKSLDKLVFDTTKTINLLILTGISSLVGLTIYLLLTWLLDVKEAKAYLALFKRFGNNWRDILHKQPEVIETTKF